jgi:hypothetical protein
MKYIIFEVAHTDSMFRAMPRCVPILFTDELSHRTVAEMFHPILRYHYNHVRAASAGVFDTNDGVCKGEAQTLGIGSLPRDTDVILSYDAKKGIAAV